MNYPQVPVRLLAHESLPGIADAFGAMDGRLLRDGAHWLMTRHEGVITGGRVAADPSRVLADRAVWADPAPDGSDTYCSPLPGGALAVSGRGAVTVHEADGTVRWEHRHRDRQHSPEAAGACEPFLPWNADKAEALTRIAAEVEPHSRLPESGDVCWFAVP
ncbi:hypothetical protein [Streptomyces virginiae]|uniref:hypothetical protein n=1 Tax=Streptomyces virginiae TaxID=1961 RepID=UPI003694D867